MGNIFNKKWFEKHQDILLWFANTFIGRRILCINGKKSSVGKNKITRIIPNAIFWEERGRKYAEFRTHNKFSKRILHAFYPIWWLMHQWDITFANNLQPAWNLGFDTLTVYPDAHPETNTVDGDVNHGGAGDYPGKQSAATGTDINDSAADWRACRHEDIGSDNFYIARSFWLFDTSPLTAEVTISAAIFSLYGTNLAYLDDDDDSIVLVLSNPASNTELSTADFDQVGTTAYAPSIDFTNWSQVAYNAFTLNATGRGAISKTSITKFGTRTQNDIDASEPSGRNMLTCYHADQTGTTNDPKLVVTYTLPTRRIFIAG